MDFKYMDEALKEAQLAFDIDEVPVGCVIVKDDKIIARGHNLRETTQQSIKHAEIVAIEAACSEIGSWRLEDCDLYVTMEPCPMCAGAILQSRIANVIYGAKDFKGGALGSNFNMYDIKGFNHYPNVIAGIKEEQSSELLKKFFKNKR